MDDTIFVGLDVHKATVSVAVAEGSRGGEVRHIGGEPARSYWQVVEQLAHPLWLESLASAPKRPRPQDWQRR